MVHDRIEICLAYLEFPNSKDAGCGIGYLELYLQPMFSAVSVLVSFQRFKRTYSVLNALGAILIIESILLILMLTSIPQDSPEFWPISLTLGQNIPHFTKKMYYIQIKAYK